MDRNDSTKKTIDMRCFRCLKGLFSAVILGMILLLTLDATVFGDNLTPDSTEQIVPEVFVTDYEAINMETMNIWGKVDKPNIMYVIPRANIEIEMKLNDEYFSSIDTDEMPRLCREQETTVAPTTCQPLLRKPFSSMNTQDVKTGLCTSCHYPEMPIPQDDYNRSLLTKLNHICLQCHPLNYYHVAWKEVEQTIFCSRDEYSSKTLCENCHPAWIQQTGEDKSGNMLQQQKYNANELCKIYHKFRATRPKKNR